MKPAMMNSNRKLANSDSDIVFKFENKKQKSLKETLKKGRFKKSKKNNNELDVDKLNVVSS
jgi:hypothetical protein